MCVNLIKPKYVLSGAMLCAALMGCASATAPSRNVREATSIMAIGGVPGAGIIALTAQALELVSKVKYKFSPGIGALLEPYAKQKKLVLFTRFNNSCKDRFTNGDWGHDDATKSKNVADFEAGKRVGIPYSSTDGNGFDIVYAYDKTSDHVLIMTPQEWQKESSR